MYLTLGTDPDRQGELYVANELDIVSNWFATLPEIENLRHQYPAEYVRRSSFLTRYYVTNVSLSPVRDGQVRRAFAMALDKIALATSYLKGYVLPATGGFVPPGMPGHVSDCSLPFDPLEAQQLLAAAGFPGGRNFPQTTLLAYPKAEVTARFLQNSWQEVLGVDISLELVKPAEFMERMALNPPAVFMGGWWADYPDPDNFLRVDIEMDLPAWHHSAYNRLLEQARRSTDQVERLELYRHAEIILAEESVLVPLTYESFHLMLKPWIKQYPTSAVKNPGFWKDVILEPHE